MPAMTPYLVELALRLGEGIELLPEETIARHSKFLLSQLRGDGGFAGREGESDPYYTSFALRSLALVGLLDDEVGGKAAEFVGPWLDRPDGSVDFLSAIFAAATIEGATGIEVLASRNDAWRESISSAWRELRRDDGGYAKTNESGSGSAYHTFLIVLASQLLEMPVDDPARIVEFVHSRRRGDGGYVEIAAMRRSGTNPAAAAVALLKMFDGLNDELRDSVLTHLCAMQGEEGGLTANTRIPVADLLSTFTGLLTIIDVAEGRAPPAPFDFERMRRYVDALEQPDGGFVGGVWDTEADVEYTFYGLGSLALLARFES